MKRASTRVEGGNVNQLIRTGTSGDAYAPANETLALDSMTDRISETQMVVQLSGGKLWQVSGSIVYPTAGSNAAKTVAVQRTLLAGFAGAQIAVAENVDIANNVTRSTTTLDRATRLTMQTVERPGATDNAVSTALAGRTGSAHQPGSNGNVTLGNDALGRQESIQQPGHANAETTAYIPGTNQVQSTTDATGATTSMAYVVQGQPGAGQVRKVTAADNGETLTEYDLLGHVQRTSGARVYPVAYHTSSLLTL